MVNDNCSVADCDNPVKRHGYCYAHYMKNWRYGTPTPEWPPKWTDLRRQRFGTLVVIERHGDRWNCLCDCGRERLASTGELNRTGDANTCGDRSIHPQVLVGYTAAHERVRAARGLVQSHTCVDCGSQAQQWSYDHTDPDELLADMGSTNLIAYSLNVERYQSRCISCHKRFDMARIHSTFTR